MSEIRKAKRPGQWENDSFRRKYARNLIEPMRNSAWNMKSIGMRSTNGKPRSVQHNQ